MKKKSSLLVAICFLGSGCGALPPFPTVEVKLVDATHAKIHKYHLPKQRGEKAPFIGSVEAKFNELEKHLCMSPSNYSKLEEYLSKVEDIAERKCK